MRDNDFIKIDDLYKGRSDREENIPPGAWRNMQDLLEKAATTGGSGGGNYSWYAVFALLTLGLGSSAVAWQINSPVSQTVVNREHANYPSSSLPSSKKLGNKTITKNQPTASSENATEEKAIAGKQATKQKSQISTNSIASNKFSQKSSKSGSVDATESAANTSIKNTITRSQKRQLRKENKQENATNAAIVKTIAASDKMSSESLQNQNSITSSTDIALEKIELRKFAPVLDNDSNYLAVVKDKTNNTKFVLPKSETGWKKEVYATVNDIERTVVSYRDASGATKYRIDTTKNTSSKRDVLLALSQKEKMALIAIASNKPTIAYLENPTSVSKKIESSEMATTVSNINIMVPIANFKVKTIKEKNSFVSRFYEVMSQYIGGEKPYYFSGNIGLQSLFSNQQASGFHIGIAGHYDFKERFTLSTELNYAFNKFSANSITDAFATYSNQTLDTTGLYPIYSASEQKFENQYALQSVSSFNLPITIRYQLSKWSVLGGVNFNYNLATKYSSLMNQNESGIQPVHSLNPFESTKPSIATQDFESRMGMSILAGVSYDLNKNLSIDLRASQNLWNSIKSQSNFSNNLYKTTGVQLSLYYFLGRKDKVVYMMNSK